MTIRDNLLGRRLVAVLVPVVLLFGSIGAAGTTSAATEGATPTVSRGSATQSLLHRQARSDTELQAQIDTQLQLAPGGEQTSRNEVSYNNGTFVVTYALPDWAPTAIPNCPSGWFCFYDGTNYTGARGRLSDCGLQDLDDYGWSDRASSVHNNTDSGVDYDQHRDYGNPANGHTYDYVLFHNSAYSAIPSLGSSNNAADHVYRYWSADCED